MQNRKLLIVFVKNPILGRVKTRLASSIGESEALEVYKILLNHTLNISKPLLNDKVVFYADFIAHDDAWRTAGFRQEVQEGNDLGERMMNALKKSFHQGYHSITIIGSDCFELTTAILNEAFDELNKKDLIVGPAQDGGYYLLAMKCLYKDLFLNKTWSSESVLRDTLKNIQDLNLSYSLLTELRDVDTEEDLRQSLLPTQKFRI